MLAILFNIDAIWLPIAMIFSAIAGFSFRSLQLRKLKKQVSSLEKEMLNSHAEVLSLQEQMARLENRNANVKSLVVSMKEVPPTDEKAELHKQGNSRKKIK
jgi:hypothetical protein